jgi:hypothetical protein
MAIHIVSEAAGYDVGRWVEVNPKDGVIMCIEAERRRNRG